MTDTGKITLPCTREEGEDLAGEVRLASGREPPVIATEEADEADPERWVLTAYAEDEPDDVLIADLLALAPSAARGDMVIERLAAQDWLTRVGHATTEYSVVTLPAARKFGVMVADRSGLWDAPFRQVDWVDVREILREAALVG